MVIMCPRARLPASATIKPPMEESSFEVPAEGVGDAAERLQARDMIAAFQTRNHRLGHPEPSRQLLLRLSGTSTQLQQLPGALRGERGAVI